MKNMGGLTKEVHMRSRKSVQIGIAAVLLTGAATLAVAAESAGDKDMVLIPKGEFTMGSNEHADEARHQVVLDLQDTDYMSSAGLRVLVSSLKTAKKSGGDLKLAQPSGRVKEVLDLAGLTPVFNVYGDVVEAVGSF